MGRACILSGDRNGWHWTPGNRCATVLAVVVCLLVWVTASFLRASPPIVTILLCELVPVARLEVQALTALAQSERAIRKIETGSNVRFGGARDSGMRPHGARALSRENEEIELERCARTLAQIAGLPGHSHSRGRSARSRGNGTGAG